MKKYIKPEMENIMITSSETISSGLADWMSGNDIQADAGITTFEIESQNGFNKVKSIQLNSPTAS